MIRKFCYKHTFLSLITLFGICTLVYGAAFYLFHVFESNCSSNIGDASTFATGLVSCFAISGGVLAVFLQHLELSLQRQELKNTRIELHNQKEEISKQTAIFKHRPPLDHTRRGGAAPRQRFRGPCRGDRQAGRHQLDRHAGEPGTRTLHPVLLCLSGQGIHRQHRD